MELVRVIWIFIFFFFALILIFMWSKMAVISSKIKSITRLLENLKKLSGAEEQVVETEKGEAAEQEPGTA